MSVLSERRRSYMVLSGIESWVFERESIYFYDQLCLIFQQVLSKMSRLFTGPSGMQRLFPPPASLSYLQVHHVGRAKPRHGAGLQTAQLPLQVACVTYIFLTISTFQPFTLIMSGGGQIEPGDAKISEKWPCSHHNNTALIKQASLVDNALVMTNT